MDSGQYGKDYEDIVERLLQIELCRVDGRDDSLVIHRRRKYLGKSGHRHEIDVSFEATVAGVAVLVLVECKCYRRQVGTDDILELSARLEDIGANKGVVVSNSGFSIGARRIASARGIALVRAVHGKWLVVMRSIGRPAPHYRYDWGHPSPITLGWNGEQLMLTFSPIDSIDLIEIGDEKVPSPFNELLDQLAVTLGQREFGARGGIIFSIEEDGGMFLRMRIGSPSDQ